MQKRITIADCQSLAENRGGRCLSTKYENAKAKLHWECGACKNRWWSPWDSVSHGTWCRLCSTARTAASQRLSLADARAAAVRRGGKCLSSEYINSKTPMEWECSNGHRWKAALDSVRAKHWCLRCSHVRPVTIEELRQTATERHGQLLSTEYLGIHRKLEWTCKNQHTWHATPDRIRAGTWCPQCAKTNNVNEHFCRIVFQHLFKTPFPTCRPEWLRPAWSKRNLELDGFSEILGIAFEHQGTQHSEHIDRFHADEAGLRNLQRRDEAKAELCQLRGVRLIHIPALERIPEKRDKLAKILKAISDAGIEAPEIEADDIRFGDAYVPADRLTQLHDVAASHGGRCEATEYVSSAAKYQFECANGHRWKSTYNNVVSNGHWCKVCRSHEAQNATRLGIEAAREAAARRGGKCLSTEYQNLRENLRFECAEGHHWSTSLGNIKSGTWCAVCSGHAARSIEECHNLAKRNGGQCLSSELKTVTEKLQWKCLKCGSIWRTSLNGMEAKKNFCTKCAGINTVTLDDCRTAAKKINAECQENNYVNARTKMAWKCNRCEKTWLAIYDSVRRGHGCKSCATKARWAKERVTKS